MSRSIVLAVAIACLAACRSAPGFIPLHSDPGPEPDLVLVWVGRGEAERFERGAWVRVPAFDYELTVEQRRYGDHWSSIKHLRRLHPAYDGSAGPRSQGMFFELAFAPPEGDRITSLIHSTLGDGTGTSDRAFRHATIELAANVSRFAPFDRYRIEQSYDYEHGRLDELVTLADGPTPWVRNHETATLFARATFPAPPTTR